MEIDNYFTIILLIGSALALLMAMFLFINSTKIFANKVLGTMNFFWFFVVFVYAMQSNEFYIKFPHLYKIVSIIPLSLFPLLYIYIKSYLSDFKWKPANFLVHFIPAIAYIIVISPFYFQSAEVKRTLIANGTFPDYLNLVNNIANITVVLQGVFYTTISMKLIQKFSSSQGKLTNDQRYILNWLRFFVITYVFIWAVGTVGAMMRIMNITVPVDLFGVFYLGLTVLTVSIGVFALRRPDILEKELTLAPDDDKPDLHFDKAVKYEDNEKDLEMIFDFLENEKAYLKNDLSLNDLVVATGIPKHRISLLLNNELGKNFYEVLNEYRTREAIRLMNDGKHINFTLTYIAELAGFNSRATFNRIFKKITNQTPSEFIQSINGTIRDDEEDY